ncbi:unnamed protein product [Soboliphyme baturini]|uniref:Glucosamine 6-phosphate N-acetyltransferase n=1 Tax=Soboliphyme baturini TaxID=241478 RepID=A0A183IK45_9BILA|nr:unnamed protein product [Soboliphyme baturini]
MTTATTLCLSNTETLLKEMKIEVIKRCVIFYCLMCINRFSCLRLSKVIAFISAQFRKMQQCLGSYYVLVVEDKSIGQIIATGTLVLEHKFIHAAGHRGRLEDLVVLSEYRGKQLGQIIMTVLTLLAETFGCYKASLECKDHLITYYARFGFQKDVGNNFLVQRFTS